MEFTIGWHRCTFSRKSSEAEARPIAAQGCPGFIRGSVRLLDGLDISDRLPGWSSGELAGGLCMNRAVIMLDKSNKLEGRRRFKLQAISPASPRPPAERQVGQLEAFISLE